MSDHEVHEDQLHGGDVRFDDRQPVGDADLDAAMFGHVPELTGHLAGHELDRQQLRLRRPGGRPRP